MHHHQDGTKEAKGEQEEQEEKDAAWTSA